jgi:hypothetical protein
MFVIKKACVRQSGELIFPHFLEYGDLFPITYFSIYDCVSGTYNDYKKLMFCNPTEKVMPFSLYWWKKRRRYVLPGV